MSRKRAFCIPELAAAMGLNPLSPESRSVGRTMSFKPAVLDIDVRGGYYSRQYELFGFGFKGGLLRF